MVLEVLVQPSSPCLMQEESKTSRRQVVASYYYATFLDWKQAFDKINHHRMFEALERTNIPPKARRIIKALYRKPFLSSSAWWVHFASILLALRLSPYLFIIVMSVLFADICRDHLRALSFMELLFCQWHSAALQKLTCNETLALRSLSPIPLMTDQVLRSEAPVPNVVFWTEKKN